ncbi:VanZ family protein [Leifsonia poae]|uniref:VanZ family protein n=1 Tax=Leifsonia poae TaxID=110933 RepID=UPI003D686CD7
MQHALSALVAVVLGGLAVLILFAPFVVISYRRRGGLTVGRTAAWVALVVYGFALVTFTLLPLPDDATISCVTAVLDPLEVLRDIAREYVRGATLLGNAALQQLAFNILFFVPLGFLLRMLFGRGMLVAALAGLTLSALIEVTQLTGVWGLFRCAYRLFDASDLFANTAGAVAGSALALLLPGARAGVRASPFDPRLPRPVTRARRLVALTVDLFACTVTPPVIVIVGELATGLADRRMEEAMPWLIPCAGLVPLAAEGWSVLATGSTLGERSTFLRGVTGRFPAVVARPVRFVAGIGGYAALLACGVGPAAAVFAAVSVIAACAIPGRGLAHVLSGMRVEDARLPQGEDEAAYSDACDRARSTR